MGKKPLILNFIKIKKFYPLKDAIKKVKRQPEEWEKVFTNHVSDKESRIYKETLQLRNKKNPF